MCGLLLNDDTLVRISMVNFHSKVPPHRSIHWYSLYNQVSLKHAMKYLPHSATKGGELPYMIPMVFYEHLNV